MQRQRPIADVSVVDPGGSRIVDARKPRHREVFETLLGEIASGRFQPGDRFPTEAELAKTFSASRSTIARAMRDLKGRGLLNRQRGGGTHITKPQDAKRIALFTPWAPTPGKLGYIGGQIHTHLSDLASQKTDHLRLQLVKPEGELLDQLVSATKVLIEQGVSGVFYYPMELPRETTHYNKVVVDRLRAAGVAVVCVDRDIVAFPDRSDVPLVTYDNRRGGYLVTEHIVRQGAKRVVFIGSPYVSSAASDRLRGYVDALEGNGLHFDRTMVRLANLEDLDAAYCRRLMEEARPDAIVCKMDHYAAIVGRHLVNMGIQIGRDVLLAGFDDEPFAEMLPVPLTTIRFPADPFAQVSYDRMTTQMANPAVPVPGQTLIDVELIVRGSTGA
jgi:GntR family transcriptional regulator of arabinose operon